jgi:Helix-turn-helix domain
MVEDKAPVRRRRMGAHGLMFRRRRIFAQLREGYTYDEIAAEEGVSPSRIRQIVSQELQQRAVDSGAEHAKLQLDRLAPAIQLGAEASPLAILPRLRLISRRSTGSTAIRPSPPRTRSMTTKRARSSWTRSIAWPRTSASTRSSRRR